MSETRIEKARVMHAEFTHHRHIGRHFGGIFGRDVHRLAADQNVERTGIKNDMPGFGMHFFPELRGVIIPDPVKVDHAGMRLCAITHQRAAGGAQIDGKTKPVVDHRRAVHQRRRIMQRAQRVIGQNRLTAAKPDLVEPHPRSHQHRERPWTNLGIERPGIACGYPVELYPAIGDHPGQQIQSPGRGFGIGHRLHTHGQGEGFHQRDNIDTALFQHRALAQVDPVHLEFGQTLGDGPPGTRKE